MSRLSLFTTTICTAAFVFANQMSVSGQDVQQTDGASEAGVVRIVSHKNETVKHRD